MRENLRLRSAFCLSVSTAGRPSGLHLAGLEGALDLFVKVVAVGDDHDPGIGDALIEGQ